MAIVQQHGVDCRAILEAVREYRRKGWLPTPLNGKNPSVGGAGWQDREHGDEEFVAGTNVGVILANGLVDIDLDSAEARRAAPYLLPPTNAIFGRLSCPRSHWFYETQGALNTKQFADPIASGEVKNRMLVELRSGNRSHQTMVPPSVHPTSGERLEWMQWGDPTIVESAALMGAAAKLAAAAVIGRYWPTSQRHLAALALAGGLARAGWSEHEVVRFVAAISAAAQDEESQDRVRAAEDTYNSLARNNPTTGWTRLQKLLGDQASILNDVRRWLALETKSDAPDAIRARVMVVSPAATPQLVTLWGHEVAEEPIIYAWRPYLALGKLTHFGGNSSQAKSPVTIDLAARFSTGESWPDGTPNVQGPKAVIILNIEDDFADTILPRFRIASGDKTNLCYVKGTRVRNRESGSLLERGVALDRDFQLLAEKARSIPNLGLVVIDPITNYLGRLKMNAEEEMRSLLTPLAKLAAELQIVVITVGHFNRREKGTDPLHRMMGAAAFTGVARAVYAFGPDPEDTSKYAHVMTAVRGAGGEGEALRYRTEMVTDKCPDGPTMDIIRIVWTGRSTATAEDSVDPKTLREKSQENAAAEILREILRDGRKSAKECQEQLKSEGFDVERLNLHRIRSLAGVASKKFPTEKFYSWYVEVAVQPDCD